jgi:hypothetical protein
MGIAALNPSYGTGGYRARGPALRDGRPAGIYAPSRVNDDFATDTRRSFRAIDVGMNREAGSAWTKCQA